ncbi:MAG TPA: hypothetical protein VFG89_05420 [Coriobacteriia bacterium]|nr:hypothetical protein [Coriobacteriia bacterium]
MEFTITCPIDGLVDVSLEDIDNVVLREADHADITFVCPHCGSEIKVTAIVPAFLLAAIEALSEEGDSDAPAGFSIIPASHFDDGETERVAVALHDEESVEFDAYCEYFRRQLEDVDCVEDALREMDGRS